MPDRETDPKRKPDPAQEPPESDADEAARQHAGRPGEAAGEAPSESGGAEPSDASAGEAAAAGQEADPRLAEFTAALEQAQGENAELKDQMLRARAEVENVRRRAQRDVENAHKYALEKFTAELLPVVDSLERAVESCRVEVETESVAAIAEGVELSLKLFLDVLEKAGIHQIDPLGQPFNPERHEAMSMVATGEAEPGSVVRVVQKGYMLHDRLVRAAMVMVAKEPES